MTPRIEKRLLQLVVAIACLLPLGAGGIGILRGPVSLTPLEAIPADLDSHFRYLSGIFFALGLAFVSCIPDIEKRGNRFRLLGSFVIVGGCARAFSLAFVGVPSSGHVIGLAVELALVPLLMVWQVGLARRWRVAYRL